MKNEMINGRSMQISLAVNLLVINEMCFCLLDLFTQKKFCKIKEVRSR
jgi:hypothetical protein